MKLERIANNLNKVTIGNYIFWFSYETVIAFKEPNKTLCISENVWTRTTGKHLNYIDKFLPRTPYDEFKERLNNLPF